MVIGLKSTDCKFQGLEKKKEFFEKAQGIILTLEVRWTIDCVMHAAKASVG